MVLICVEQRCASQTLDLELAWMLPYYYMIADAFLSTGAPAPAATKYCKAKAPAGPIDPPKDAVFVGRGAMGRYWESLRQGQAKRDRRAHRGR